MQLKYTNLDDVVIHNTQSLNINNVNNAILHLLENDLNLANPDGFSPTIWECKWYNDDNVAGYRNGDAVWINTENPYNFIEFYAEKIYNYAKSNPYLKNIIEPYTPYNYDLYYNILTGYHIDNTTTILPPLFDIGDFTKPAQIKISRYDNNKALLSDSNAWKDFIIRDDYQSVKKVLQDNLKTMFNKHIEQYHLDDNKLSSTIGTYLLKDLSNAENTQKLDTHIDSFEKIGFDYVVKFVKKPEQIKFINSVLSTTYISNYWKLTDYDKYAEDGELKPETKTTYIAQLSGCANYISDNIEESINNLTDKAIVNIKYTAHNSTTLVPQSSTIFNEISANINKYDCTYELALLETNMSAYIKTQIDQYTQIQTVESVYYPEVTYTYYKWFRLWNSGYLEHGGIVPIEQVGNTTVSLDWNYIDNDLSVVAPTYDYPESTFPFYGSHTKFSNDNGLTYDANNNLNTTNRYVVQLTPINNILSDSLSGNNLMYGNNDNQLCTYCNIEINTIKNTNFSIFIDNNNTPYYSYYVSGYKTNI